MTPQTKNNPEQLEAWRVGLWEACDLLGLTEELISAVQESDVNLAIPSTGPANESH